MAGGQFFILFVMRQVVGQPQVECKTEGQFLCAMEPYY